MDCAKVGNLIYKLRREQGLTQRQLADKLNISDRTISKWERGLGCPDVSLLAELSEGLGVNIEQLLDGELSPNNIDGGNMKRLKFYSCPSCGNIMTATGNAELSCCGRKLSPLIAKPADEEHTLKLETIENDYYISFEHEMTKQHFISFVSYLSYDRTLLVRLYPEQGGELRVPQMRGGRFYFCCSKDGLFVL